MEQVGVTPAVATAEANDRRGAGHFCEGECPGVLEADGSVAVPNDQRRRGVPQVVDVPVFLLRFSAVAPDASRDATGSERTADIHVVARLDFETTPAPDLHARVRLALENQGIGSRF